MLFTGLTLYWTGNRDQERKAPGEQVPGRVQFMERISD
jgi:hypothetical protein